MPELEVPDIVNSPNFPFDGVLSVRKIEPRLDAEHVRNGDPDGPPCYRCEGDGPTVEPIWANERWAVRSLTFDGKPSPFPAYLLETVEHLDIAELTEELAAELGVFTLRLERAIMAIGTVGRVHFNRWGDGAAHFHVWFLGRPIGAVQLRGYALPLWGLTLPALPEDEHASNDRIVAEHMHAASL